MKGFIRKATAFLALTAMLMTSSVSGLMSENILHVHAGEHEETALVFVTAEELASGEVLFATAEMLDESGNLVIDEGDWKKIVVPRSINAKKVTVKGISVDTLILESGTECSFELRNCEVANLVVESPTVEVVDYAKIQELLAAGVDISVVAEKLNNYNTEKEFIRNTQPKIVLKGNTKADSILVKGNANLNLTGVEAGEVKVENHGSQTWLGVTVQGYNGALSVHQDALTTGENNIVKIDLKKSELTGLTVDGPQKTVCSVSGDGKSSVALAEVTGANALTLLVDVTDVTIGEEATGANVSLYSDVENLLVTGAKNIVRVAASAKVENTTITGNNVTLNVTGTVKNYEITGEGSGLVYVPLFTVTPKPTATPVPTEVPKPTATPKPTAAPGVHVHTWNVEVATCVTEKYCTDCGYLEESATGIHSFTDKKVVTAPTCTEGGFTTYTCDYCDETKIGDITAFAGHTITTWTAGTLVEGKTCEYTQSGVCTVCGKTLTSDATVEKHNTNLVFNIETEATCVTPGTKVYNCPDCQKEISRESYTNADAHSWDAGTTVDGKTVYKCTNSGCSATKSVVAMTSEGVDASVLDSSTEVSVGSVAVTFDDSVVNQITNAGTDTTETTTVKVSADTLGASEREAAVEKLTEKEKEQLGSNEIYDFNMLVNDEPVSAFSGSVTVRIPYTISADEDPDEIGVWYIADDGSVTAVKGKYYDGYVSFETNHFSYYTVVRLTPEAKCNLFGHITISAVTSPTCSEDGYITTVCQRCGDTSITAGEKATGHDIVESVVEEATCQHKGKHRYECNNKNCEFYTEVETPKGDHKPKVSKSVEATCVEDGYIEYKCDCEYHKKEVIPALGHLMGEDGHCKNCGINMTCEHPYTEMFVSLKEGATTCEDGVLCEVYCLLCGDIVDEWTSTEHEEGVLELLNMHGYGNTCGGAVCMYGCACGELQTWFGLDFVNGNAWSWDHHWETDENGVEWGVAEHICEADSVIIRQRYQDTPIEGETCKVTRQEIWQLVVNDEVKETISADTIQYNHNCFFTAKLAEGSKTCEDGIICTDYCINCKQEVGTWESDYHEYAVVEAIDLSEFDGFCGGYVLIEKCPCGEQGSTNFWGYTECQFDSNWSWKEDENGNSVETETYTCTECGSIISDVYTITSKGNCKANRDGAITVFENGTAVKTYEYSFEQGYHRSYDVVELAEGSKTCEDGAIIKSYCYDCDRYLGEWTSYWHQGGIQKTVDLSEYTGTCGGEIEFYKCACGAESWWNQNTNCSLVWNYKGIVDNNGMEHEVETVTCRNCDFNFTRDTVVAKSSDTCSAAVNYEYLFYVGDKLVDSYKYSAVEERHDTYVVDAALREGSITCEDGITYTEKCRNCDYTWTGNGSWHAAVLVDGVDLADYGVVCGGVIGRYECACGENSYSEANLNCDTGYSWFDMRYNNYSNFKVVDGVEIATAEYVCAVTDPKCGLHITMERREKVYPEACKTDREIYLHGDLEGDGTYEFSVLVEEETFDSHSQLGEEVITYATADDGTPLEVHTRACEGCGKYKDIATYADYLKDGSYKYHIRNEWGAEGGTIQYEDFKYAFTADGCSYTRIRSNSNGYYEERETQPGCVTDKVTQWSNCTEYSYGVCAMCGNTNPLNPRMYGWPDGHDFVKKESGNGYYCTRCDLESENGSSGQIVLTDASDDTNYIASYWNQEQLVYGVVVFLVVNGESIVTDLTVADNGNFETGTASIAKSAVDAWAAANGVTGSYVAGFSFIPKNVSEDLSYNITFTQKHNWTTKAELLEGSNSCTDGVLVTEYCADCGEIRDSWQSNEHVQVETAVLDLNASSVACGGYVYTYECLCGEQSGLNLWRHTDCNIKQISSSGKDGIYYREYECSICGVRMVLEYTYTKLENCRALNVGTLRLYDGETEVASVPVEFVENSHSTRRTVKLAENSTTCEDGVIVQNICWDCGMEFDTYTIYSHERGVADFIDWNGVEGTCGGRLISYSCACGLDTSIGWNTPCYFMYNTEWVTDEAGVEHQIQTRTCQNCSIKVVGDCVYSEVKDCMRNGTVTYTVYNGDVVLGEITGTVSETFHNWVTTDLTLVTEGTTCDQGVNRTMVCSDCGQTTSGVINYHERITEVIADFSKYEGTCGGQYAYGKCACGNNEGVGFWNSNCKLNTKKEWVTDETTGKGYDLFTITCDNCSVKVVYTYTDVKGEGCKATRTFEYEAYVGDELVGTYNYQTEVDSHIGYIASCELVTPGTTCEEGVITTHKCRNCDWTNTNKITWHETYAVETIDLSKYENTCGGEFALRRCACGENQFVNTASKCNFSHRNEGYYDEDGYWHNVKNAECVNCSVKYVLDEKTVPGDNCMATVEFTYTVYVGEEEIGTLECTGEREYHTSYISSIKLDEGSVTCADGIVFTETCSKCGVVNAEGRTNSHMTMLTETINVGCGTKLDVYECACGVSDMCTIEATMACNTGLSWSNMWCNGYGEEETTEEGVVAYTEHTCPVCGYTYKFKRIDCSDETMTKYQCYFLFEDKTYRVGMYGH